MRTSMRAFFRSTVGLGLIAVLALVGTAVAAKAITGKQVKNESLTGKDVKNGSLSSDDFSGSLQGPKGDTGATGQQGAQGPSGLSNLEQVVMNDTVPASTLGYVVTAICPAGKVAISGGYNVNDLTAPVAKAMADFNTGTGTIDRWRVSFDNVGSAESVGVNVYANCATVTGGFPAP